MNMSLDRVNKEIINKSNLSTLEAYLHAMISLKMV